jgi:hypothetical protein
MSTELVCKLERQIKKLRKALVKIQDEGNVRANSIATKALGKNPPKYRTLRP